MASNLSLRGFFGPDNFFIVGKNHWRILEESVGQFNLQTSQKGNHWY